MIGLSIWGITKDSIHGWIGIFLFTIIAILLIIKKLKRNNDIVADIDIED